MVELLCACVLVPCARTNAHPNMLSAVPPQNHTHADVDGTKIDMHLHANTYAYTQINIHTQTQKHGRKDLWKVSEAVGKEGVEVRGWFVVGFVKAQDSTVVGPRVVDRVNRANQSDVCCVSALCALCAI